MQGPFSLELLYWLKWVWHLQGVRSLPLACFYSECLWMCTVTSSNGKGGREGGREGEREIGMAHNSMYIHNI